MSEEIRLTGLERLLVRGTYMSVEDVVAASRRAKEADIDLITYIQQKQLLSDLDIAQIVSNSVGFEYIDLDANYKAHSVPKNLVSEKLIIKHKILPLFFKDEVLHVAISNPAHIQFVDKIKFETGKKVVIHVAEHSKIQHYIDSVYGQFETGKVVTTEELVKSIMSDGTFQDIDDEDDDGGFNNDYDASAPAIQFINKMLKDAVRMKASDLHFEPFEKHYRIRFRIDGVLRFVEQLPSMVSTRLSSRLKVMAGMDISEKRNPQDGRIRLHLTDSRSIDFRVNSLPTVYGEKIVLRILDSSSAQLGIDQLGYEPDQKEMFLEALHKPQGMVLITGPTGSGKTVSLYTGLNILNEMDTNISTAEDPVEINLDGINQVNVNPKAGLTFATVLKAFLRQDPDVIMVGEIRDLETAEIAIKAAQTGHMVMSTLHTNSAPETLTRLRNMGIPAFNVATSVNLVIAQRLARKLCDKCKSEYHAPREILEGFGFTAAQLDDPNFKIYSAVGCQDCVEGYKGRVGVYEVMKITPEISRIIMRDGNAIEIADASKKAGFNTLRESGINKILAGLTSMSEILRITSDSGVTLD